MKGSNQTRSRIVFIVRTAVLAIALALCAATLTFPANAQAAWVKRDGAYFWLNADGSFARSQWIKYKGGYYYINKSGNPTVSGWATYNGKYYFMGSNGKPKKEGWVKYKGNFYYINGYNPVTGWKKIDGVWRYFDQNAALVIGDWAPYGSTYYRIDDQGKASATVDPITLVARDVATPYGTVKGWLIPAQGATAAPTIVFSHGLGSIGSSFLSEGLELASMGINVYIFDFIGGSEYSTSGGSFQQMSVLTEKTQLEAIVDAARTWPEVNPYQLYLGGHSQGGLLSTKVASERNDIAGIILFAPALNLGDMVRTRCGSLSHVASTFTFLTKTLGHIYAEDIWNITEADVEAAYTGTSIVFHGWNDTVIDPQVSVRAKQTWGDACELHMLSGIDHFTVINLNTTVAREVYLYVMNNN